jgi:hypothetical protein
MYISWAPNFSTTYFRKPPNFQSCATRYHTEEYADTQRKVPKHLAQANRGKEVAKVIDAASTAAQSLLVGTLENVGQALLLDGVDNADGIANNVDALEDAAGGLRRKRKD